MKSFGRLLRKLRGTTPLEELTMATKLEPGYLASIEAGRTVPEEVVARHILRQGLGLDRVETARVILGIQLYDLGLRDADFRQLVIDLILKSVPAPAREELRCLYRRYSRTD